MHLCNILGFSIFMLLVKVIIMITWAIFFFFYFANLKNDVYWQLCIVWCMCKPIWVFFLISYVVWHCVYFVAYAKHAIPVQICTTGRYLHIWIHSYNQGMPRLAIQFVLWYHSIIPRKWIFILLRIVIRWLLINPYKMGDWL